MSAPALKKRAAVTPATSTATTPVLVSLSSFTPLLPGAHSAMLINQDVSPPHAYHRPSILQPIYKHLPPKDIVCLKAGDKIIVVIPVFAVNRKVADNIACILTSYMRAFERGVNNTLRCLHPGNHTSLVSDIVRESHTLLRKGRAFLEYSCHVRNFAEQEYLKRELLDHRAVKMYWQQGAGIILSLCGYSMQRLVMMEFCHIGYLEIYGRIK